MTPPDKVFVRVTGVPGRGQVEVVDQGTGEVVADLSKWVGGWSYDQHFGQGGIGMIRLELPVEVANIETLQLNAHPARSV